MKRRIIYTLALVMVALQAFSQTYTYDNLNRLTKVVYGNGVTVTYGYDALGNRTSKKVTGATGTTFTISVAVTPQGSGSVTGAGSYSSGATVELNAIANAGYKFEKWTDGVTDNPRTITVTQNMTYTAKFVEDSSTPSIVGDIVVDGKVNQQDLNALVQAYVSNTNVTTVTDIDGDGSLTMADITKLIKIINDNKIDFDANGHEFVDLGLPSGTLWATCNIGASAPEEAGNHYAWGETETKTNYSWETYKWSDGTKPTNTNASLTKYCDRGAYGKLDGKLSLELEDDAAHVNWGGDWHMPTQEEFQELMENCTFEWITLENGNKAYKITGSNGNSIILPRAGRYNGESLSSSNFYYWSSTLVGINNSYGSRNSYALDRETSSAAGVVGLGRFYGNPIRPVLSQYTPSIKKIFDAPSSYLDHELVDLGLPSGALFAKCNLGATSPEDYGCNYSWGEIIGSCDGKTSFLDTDYIYYNGSEFTKYTQYGDELEPADDAAVMKWGGKWRMPTNKELNQLIDSEYTVSEWTTENGVNGYRITSIVKGFEGNYIFLPAAGYFSDKTGRRLHAGEVGYYWNTLVDSDTDGTTNGNARGITLKSSYIVKASIPRYYGNSIRPVVSFDDIVK